MSRANPRALRSQAALRKQMQLNQQAQWALSIALAQTQRRLAFLEQQMDCMEQVNEQLRQNWRLAQDRINLLTDHHNAMALATQQEGTWTN